MIDLMPDLYGIGAQGFGVIRLGGLPKLNILGYSKLRCPTMNCPMSTFPLWLG